MKKQKFFFGETAGLNADIERHRKMEKKLQEDIAKHKASDSKFSERHVATYKRFLDLLLASKAEVVSKIGKK